MSECKWAKIVESSDGQHVLFYLEHDGEHEDCQILHCVARFDGFDGDVKLAGIKNEKAEAALASFMHAEQADRVIIMVKQMMSEGGQR